MYFQEFHSLSNIQRCLSRNATVAIATLLSRLQKEPRSELWNQVSLLNCRQVDCIVIYFSKVDSWKQWSPLNPYVNHSSTFTFSGHYHNIYLSRKQGKEKTTLSRQFLSQITQAPTAKNRPDMGYSVLGNSRGPVGQWGPGVSFCGGEGRLEKVDELWNLQQLELSQDTSAAQRSLTRSQSDSHTRKMMGSRGITSVLYRLKMGQCSPIILFTYRWIEY